MAKTKISEYDATAGNNTDIDSINIAEGMLPSNVNNAIREMMAHLKDMDAGTQALTSPQLSSVDINGGTIDGVTIGGASAGAGSFTTINASGTVTATGTSVFASLDISGDIDVDGTTNLDVVDIDGAVDMASTLKTSGHVAFNGAALLGQSGISEGALNFDSGSNYGLEIKDTGTGSTGTSQIFYRGSDAFGAFSSNSNNFLISSTQSDKDLIFKGNDGGATITALTLDMSEAGAATFNDAVGIGMAPDSAVKLSVNGAVGPTNGSEGSPTHTFYGDPDTGMFRAAANTLGFSTGGTEAMRIDSAGRVLIGQSSSTGSANADELVVGSGSGNQGITIFSGASNGSTIAFKDSGADEDGFISFNHASQFMQFGTAASEAMRILSSGNVGIGDTSPDRKLHVNSGTDNVVAKFESTDSVASIEFVDSGGGSAEIGAQGNSLLFFPAGAEKLRLDSSGNLLVSKSSVNSGVVGVEAKADGTLVATVDGDTVSILNRLTSDGEILRLQKDGNTIGTLGSNTTSGQTLFDIASEADAASNMRFLTSSGSSLSEVMRLTNAGSLLVGESSSSANMAGLELASNGQLYASSSSSSGHFFNISHGSDGNIVSLRKDGTTVGSIASRSGATTMIHLNPDSTNGAGLGGATKSIIPTDHSSISDNNISLGTSSYRFKDLHLSNDVFINKTTKTAASDDGIVLDGDGFGYFVRSSGVQLLVGSLDSGGASEEAIRFVRGGSDVGSIDTTGSATSYNTSSDYRLKTDVQPMTGSTDRLKQLNPVNFEWIADGTRVDGFLAHEAQAIVPEAVTGTKDAMRDEEYEVTPAVTDDDGNVTTEAVMGTRSVPDYQGIDQSKLVPLLVATIQELEARITALEGA